MPNEEDLTLNWGDPSFSSQYKLFKLSPCCGAAVSSLQNRTYLAAMCLYVAWGDYENKLRRMPNDDRLDLWSLDECHFQQHGTRCRMWIPPETKDPIVLHAPTRKSLALFGAVNLRTGQLVTMFCPVFDAGTFEVFLRLLARHRRRHFTTMFVLDNATYHHAADESSTSYRLDFLPPYSPDLNPIERVWKLLRRLATHNEYFATLDDLVPAAQGQILQFQHPNETLRTLCCKN